MPNFLKRTSTPESLLELLRVWSKRLPCVIGWRNCCQSSRWEQKIIFSRCWGTRVPNGNEIFFTLTLDENSKKLSITPYASRFKHSNIQKFKVPKFQKFKNSKMQLFQKFNFFKISKIQSSEVSKTLKSIKNSKTPTFEESIPKCQPPHPSRLGGIDLNRKMKMSIFVIAPYVGGIVLQRVLVRIDGSADNRFQDA